MNTLPLDKKLTILDAMVEGNSIRSTERMTGVHRDTIMRLTARTGEQCRDFLDVRVRGIRAERVQADEIWTYVFKKQGRWPGHKNRRAPLKLCPVHRVLCDERALRVLPASRCQVHGHPLQFVSRHPLHLLPASEAEAGSAGE